jgi:hypothetical protein
MPHGFFGFEGDSIHKQTSGKTLYGYLNITEN